jgi:thiol-disulfide isomerase/thioredoxin
MDDRKTTASPQRRRLALAIGAVALLGAVLGAGAIYGIAPSSRNGESACPGAQALVDKLSPLARGDVAALNVARNPVPLVPLAFQRPDGRPATIADFKGRVVLLNLWATWCVPCRTEMPALDKLQASAGGPDFEVVAVNIDQRNIERAAAFLDKAGVATLTRYADPSAKIFADLKGAGLAFGMPTSILLDRQGCVLASLAGPAEWAGEDARAFVAAALRR